MGAQKVRTKKTHASQELGILRWSKYLAFRVSGQKKIIGGLVVATKDLIHRALGPVGIGILNAHVSGLLTGRCSLILKAQVPKYDGITRPQNPRSSKYPIFKDSGPKYHEGYGFWNQKAQILGTWTLWESIMGGTLLCLSTRAVGFLRSLMGASRTPPHLKEQGDRKIYRKLSWLFESCRRDLGFRIVSSEFSVSLVTFVPCQEE